MPGAFIEKNGRMDEWCVWLHDMSFCIIVITTLTYLLNKHLLRDYVTGMVLSPEGHMISWPNAQKSMMNRMLRYQQPFT